MSFMVLQTVIPLSSEEIELQANIYKNKHPGRIVMSTLRIPFIDETESWYYEAIMLCELYGGFFMQILLTPIVLPLVVFTNLAFSICLYQLTDTSSSLSKVRKCKFLFEIITLTLQYFFLNNSSEIMDDCNAMVCRSINSSHWQHCTLDTKRGLMSLLRICQRPNHLEFYGGVIIPSRDFFLKVIKIAYSFVNFIRCT
ncbi:uncharacterized protein LOC113470827 [Diaphorina citri]|uniref:Uncharacterized protein LOC113470827 n=1 Tax=Diaphorina citri TaxID=121845 RepID=A0A3Q0JF91_DIACI|nr:uncharacterized protein LOC113470827 [Diaphorina citri]